MKSAFFDLKIFNFLAIPTSILSYPRHKNNNNDKNNKSENGRACDLSRIQIILPPHPFYCHRYESLYHHLLIRKTCLSNFRKERSVVLTCYPLDKMPYWLPPLRGLIKCLHGARSTIHHPARSQAVTDFNPLHVCRQSNLSENEA